MARNEAPIGVVGFVVLAQRRGVIAVPHSGRPVGFGPNAVGVSKKYNST
jgi:hypothetical protein